METWQYCTVFLIMIETFILFFKRLSWHTLLPDLTWGMERRNCMLKQLASPGSHLTPSEYSRRVPLLKIGPMCDTCWPSHGCLCNLTSQSAVLSPVWCQVRWKGMPSQSSSKSWLKIRPCMVIFMLAPSLRTCGKKIWHLLNELSTIRKTCTVFCLSAIQHTAHGQKKAVWTTPFIESMHDYTAIASVSLHWQRYLKVAHISSMLSLLKANKSHGVVEEELYLQQRLANH